MKNEYVVALVFVPIAIAIIFGYLALVPMERMTVSATGISEFDLEPDIAEVGFRITTTHNTSSEIASEENAEISNDVIYELRRVGLSIYDIETVSYYVRDEYEWIYGQREFKYYKAVHVIKATVSDIDDVGICIDVATSSGALVDYCEYDLSPENLNNAKIQALESASADARAKAIAILSGVNKELGELISISTDYGYYPYRAYEIGVSDIDEKNHEIPQILPENVDVSATVHVVYEID